MKRFVSVLCLAVAVSVGHGGAYKLTNECKDVEFTKIEYGMKRSFMGEESYGFQYGLKNRSDKPVKWKLHIDLLDKENHVTDEMDFSGELKPYRERGFDKETYYPVGEDLLTFSGDINITLKCEHAKTDPKPTAKQGVQGKAPGTIVLQKSAFKMLKDMDDFEAQATVAVLLRLVEAKGGMEAFLEIVKPCLLKDEEKKKQEQSK